MMKLNLDTAADKIEAMVAASADADPPISEETAEATRDFLLELSETAVSAGVALDHPHLARCCDGAISVYWDRLDNDDPDRPWVEVSVGDKEHEIRNTAVGVNGIIVVRTVDGWAKAIDAVLECARAMGGER